MGEGSNAGRRFVKILLEEETIHRNRFASSARGLSRKEDEPHAGASCNA
jgi:hypothetical protein